MMYPSLRREEERREEKEKKKIKSHVKLKNNIILINIIMSIKNYTSTSNCLEGDWNWNLHFEILGIKIETKSSFWILKFKHQECNLPLYIFFF